MFCYRDPALMRYLDKGFSPRKLRGMERHLAACPRCRRKAESLAREKNALHRELSVIDPETIPREEFVLPAGETVMPRQPRPGWYEFFRPPMLLKPAGVLAFLALAVLVLAALLWWGPGNGPGLPLGTGHFDARGTAQPVLRAASIAGEPVETFIIEEKETHTTFIWIEKKEEEPLSENT